MKDEDSQLKAGRIMGSQESCFAGSLPRWSSWRPARQQFRANADECEQKYEPPHPIINAKLADHAIELAGQYGLLAYREEARTYFRKRGAQSVSPLPVN
jgi:hypothetical protein